MNPVASARRLALPTALLLLTALAACSTKDTPTTLPAGPDTISITHAALYPESMAYDAASDRFLLGSLTAGAVGQVATDGTYSPLADDAQLVSSTGILAFL